MSQSCFILCFENFYRDFSFMKEALLYDDHTLMVAYMHLKRSNIMAQYGVILVFIDSKSRKMMTYLRPFCEIFQGIGFLRLWNIPEAAVTIFLNN